MDPETCLSLTGSERLSHQAAIIRLLDTGWQGAMQKGLNHPSQAQLSTASSQGPLLVGIVVETVISPGKRRRSSYNLLPALSPSTETPGSTEEKLTISRLGSQDGSLVTWQPLWEQEAEEKGEQF